MSLLQFEDDVMPFNFADIVMLSYLAGDIDAQESVNIFNSINDSSNLKWSYKAQVIKCLLIIHLVECSLINETSSFYHGEEVLHRLGCTPVAASDIM